MKKDNYFTFLYVVILLFIHSCLTIYVELIMTSTEFEKKSKTLIILKN